MILSHHTQCSGGWTRLESLIAWPTVAPGEMTKPPSMGAVYAGYCPLQLGTQGKYRVICERVKVRSAHGFSHKGEHCRMLNKALLSASNNLTFGLKYNQGVTQMVNKRLTQATIHCNWCNRIHSGHSWLPDRRRVRTGPYANLVCKGCRSFYFAGFDLDEFIAWCRKEEG